MLSRNGNNSTPSNSCIFIQNMKKDLDEVMRQKAALANDVEKCQTNQEEATKKVEELNAIVKDKQGELDDLSQKNKDLKGPTYRLTNIHTECSNYKWMGST